MTGTHEIDTYEPPTGPPMLPAPEPQVGVLKLIEVAIAKDLDIEKLEKLLALQREAEARLAEKEFRAAKAAFLQECPKIEHDCTAKTPNATWTYASLGAIAETVNPLLGKHGLDYRWEVNDEETRLTCILSHVAGHKESASFTLSTEGQKGGLARMTTQQQQGAADTYAKGRTLKHVLGIATADGDTDGVGAQTEPEDFRDRQATQNELDNLKIAWLESKIDDTPDAKDCRPEELAELFEAFSHRHITISDGWMKNEFPYLLITYGQICDLWTVLKGRSDASANKEAGRADHS